MYNIKNRKINYEKNKIEKDLKNKLEDLQKEKAEYLTNIGIFIYEKIRSGKNTYNELESECEKITNIDKEIYNVITTINRSTIEKDFKCSCGNALGVDDKFCSECGEKIHIEPINKVVCRNCNTKVNREFDFCVCCGNKIEKI